MRKQLAVLMVALLVLPAGVSAVPDARLTFSGLTVAPTGPVVGEPVTVTGTLQNSGGSPEPVEIDRVVLQRAGSGERLAMGEDPGALSQGGTLTVDLVHAFEEQGRQDLQLVAKGTDGNDETVRVVRPVTVLVEEANPAMEVEIAQPVAGAATPVEVNVSNPAAETRRNIAIDLQLEAGDGSRRVIPTLPSGATAGVNLTLQASEPGNQELTIYMNYTTSTGDRQSTSSVRQIEAVTMREDVGVAVTKVSMEAAQAAGGGNLQSLLGGGAAAAGGSTLQQQETATSQSDGRQITVTNFGNIEVSSVVIQPAVGENALARRYVGSLTPGQSESITLDLEGVDGSELRVETTYRYADNERGTASRVQQLNPNKGEVRLTDLDLSQSEDGTLTISGNTGNTGDGEVTALVVAVAEGEGVEPVYPQRTYFVGSVAPSEFAPFELTAEVSGQNVSSIPLEVSYRTGNEVVEDTIELPYDDSLGSVEQSGLTVGSALRTTALTGSALALIALVPATYLIRRR